MRLFLKAICIEEVMDANFKTTPCAFRSNTGQLAEGNLRLKKTGDDVIFAAEQHHRTTGHRVQIFGSIGRENSHE